ncbi:MAG: class I SAM-dependent methyltransferase [Candidatus Omnitrophica bacterium]|nr:class I SAM-dependent methyltransferase [Candidatus Omnitrophota bacterium]
MAGALEKLHRERKRKAEMEIALRHLENHVPWAGKKRILEFGSGGGYQIPYLRRLGDVVASDIYQSGISPDGFDFVLCDIRKAPFDSGSFDLVFANHVLEHIPDVMNAFSELRRIGKDGCIYAFTVPTNVWLWLSLPAQVYNGARKLFNMNPARRNAVKVRADTVEIKTWRRFLPRGHGWQKGFFDCMESFRVESWRSLFEQNGFKVIEAAPLLLYSPSEFPVIPTTRFFAEKGIYSSAIFIMRKQAA